MRFYVIAAMATLGLLQAAAQNSGAIQGVVRHMDGTAPVEGASVSLTPAGLMPSEQVALATVRTDTDGRFSFANVPDGAYRVTVEGGGHFARAETAICPPREVTSLSQSTGLGTALRISTMRLAATANVCVVIASGQHVENISVNLISGATIAGRILDPEGKPAVNLAVEALPVGEQGETKSARTNDRGEYRLYWLAPGDYAVRAIPRTPAITPRPDDAYARTYFPGKMDRSEAVPIHLSEGLEVTNINFSVQTSPSLTISGRVINTEATGGSLLQPNFSFFLLPRDGEPPDSRRPEALLNAARDRTDGSFEIRAVKPGEYDLVALAAGARSRLVGRVPLVVGASNLENIVITATAGVALSGHAALHSAATNSVPGLNTPGFQLFPEDAAPSLQTLLQLPSIRPDSTGAFSVAGIPPGTYSLVDPSSTAYVLEVREGSPASTNTGGTRIVVGNSPPGPLEVRFDLLGNLSGTVKDAQRQPLVDALAVLIFRAPGQTGLTFKTITTSTTGNFSFRNLLPGTYSLALWPMGGMSASVLNRPEVLSSAQALGDVITITPGATFLLDYRATVRPENPQLLFAPALALAAADASNASVEGRIWNAELQRAPNATVVLVPDAARRSNLDLWKTAKASASGYFLFRGAISGQYTLLAFEGSPPDTLRTPEFLAAAEPLGRQVAVNPAGSNTVQVRVLRPPTDR